jgi:hypothetical protein
VRHPSHGLICASSTARNEPALCRPRQRQLVADRRQAAEAELHDAADEVGAGSQTAVAASAPTRARCAEACGRSAGQRLEPAWSDGPDPRRRGGAPPAARRTMRGGATAGRLRREPRQLGMIGTAHDGSAESRTALEVAAGLAAQRNARVDIVATRATSIWTSARTDHGSSPRPRRGLEESFAPQFQTVPRPRQCGRPAPWCAATRSVLAERAEPRPARARGHGGTPPACCSTRCPPSPCSPHPPP